MDARRRSRKYHAIECRINAEDPFNNFQPCPGKIELYYAPAAAASASIRTFTPATPSRRITIRMIAKVIGMGTTRANAIARMGRALGEYLITGIKTTIPFQQAIMREPRFRARHNTTPASSRK